MYITGEVRRDVLTMTSDTSDPRTGRILGGPKPPDNAAGRLTGRQLAAGLAAAIALAVILAGATIPLARALAPQWARTEGLTVLVVAEVYLAITAGLLTGTAATAATTAPRAGRFAEARRLLAFQRPALGQVAAALGLVAAACVAGLAISLAFSPLTGGLIATLKAIVRDGSDESRMAAATPLVWALIVVRVAALTGVAEELLFRGALYGWLRGRLSVPATIAVTSVLFALEHAYYPLLIPLVLTCGLATGWVRHRTGTVGATIPMHIAVDLALFLAAAALTT